MTFEGDLRARGTLRIETGGGEGMSADVTLPGS